MKPPHSSLSLYLLEIKHRFLSLTPTARGQKDDVLFTLSLLHTHHPAERKKFSFSHSSSTVLTQFLLFSQLFTGNLAAAGNGHSNPHVTLLWLGTGTFCRLKEITTTLHIWKVSPPQQRTKKRVPSLRTKPAENRARSPCCLGRVNKHISKPSLWSRQKCY